MRKLVAAGLVTAGIASGSIAVAAVAPLTLASAQTEGNGSTTTQPANPAPDQGQKGHNGIFADALKSLVADGTITQDQADKIQARVQEKAQQARDQRQAAKTAEVDKIAGIIGISADDLKSQLQSGKTLAQIAGDKTDAVVKALTDDANARIDQAVANGKLSADQAANLKTKTAARINDVVQNGHGLAMLFGGPGGPGGRRGHGRGGF
jgi:hypothetical protein